MFVRRAFAVAVLGALCLCACDGGSENGSKPGVSASASKASDSSRVLSLEDGRKEALKFPTGSSNDGSGSVEVANSYVCELFSSGTADMPSLSWLLSNAVEPEGNLPMSIGLLHMSLGLSDGVLHERLVDLAAPFEAEFLEMMGKGTFDFDYDYASAAAAAVFDACNKIQGW
ncbi:hypothetical protein [uncultured Mobiluncus sp.]|uniref:hypothetical protein n=1 Tax=uncultured Mobiluncus sp. TaxID=293425 RepID=UPI00263310B3|nr:hypothetical protein [uncultured Mobiluncus sp.]